MGLQRIQERRKMPMEISLDILEDIANQVHQFHHIVQLSHYKLSALK
jgi:hypothetical protein